MTRPLTRSQSKLLGFIVLYIDQYGYAPTYREMCAATGIKSTSSIAHQLNSLEARGLIRRGGFHGHRRLSLKPVTP